MSQSIYFYKYQSTGNDFIILDNTTRGVSKFLSTDFVNLICDRHFGVGADGCVVIEPCESELFYMRYFNRDGNESTVCANGIRAAVLFAFHQRKISLQQKINFLAIDGKHAAIVLSEINQQGIVKSSLISKMVPAFVNQNTYFIDTGSPHVVIFVDDPDKIELEKDGRAIRYDERTYPGGTNVNFSGVLDDNTLYVRTYERGVEGETLSCGTGVVASAICWAFKNNLEGNIKVNIKTKGGILSVEFNRQEDYVDQVYLTGASQKVFEGYYYL